MSKEIQPAALDVSFKCKDFVLRQTAISELLLDIGWLLKKPKSDGLQNQLTLTQIQRFNCLLSFLIQNESATVLMKILQSLKTVMDTKKVCNYDNSTNGNAVMKLFQKNLEHAEKIVHQRIQPVGELNLCPAGQEEYSCEYGRNDMLSPALSTREVNISDSRVFFLSFFSLLGK